MQTRWTTHLKHVDDKDEFKQYVKQHPRILERLVQLIDNDIASVLKDTADEQSFTLPAWSEYQAFKMGEIARLQKMKALVDIK